MTQDEIIAMARQAGFVEYELDDGTTNAFDKRYEAFAKLVEEAAASKEREACELVCKEIYRAWVCESDDDVDYPDPHDCMRAIRARGEPTSRGES